MKKIKILQWTDLIGVCSESTFRIMKLVILLFMVTVLNAFGGGPFNSNPNPDIAIDPAIMMQQASVRSYLPTLRVYSTPNSATKSLQPV